MQCSIRKTTLVNLNINYSLTFDQSKVDYTNHHRCYLGKQQTH